jgi:hypothetical protein
MVRSIWFTLLKTGEDESALPHDTWPRIQPDEAMCQKTDLGSVVRSNQP